MMAVLLASIALAGGHALPVVTARNTALREARQLALVFKPNVPRVTMPLRACRRRSSRTVDCTATFMFPRHETCTRVIRVRATSRGLRTSLPGEPHCKP